MEEKRFVVARYVEDVVVRHGLDRGALVRRGLVVLVGEEGGGQVAQEGAAGGGGDVGGAAGVSTYAQA